MKSFLKNLKLISIFLVIECFFYLQIRPKNLEMFFMVWGFISFILLLYNVFDVKTDGSLFLLGSHTETGGISKSIISSISAEKEYAICRNKSSGGLLDLINLVCLTMLIFNIIGYIFVISTFNI